MFRIIKDSHVDTQTSSNLSKLPVVDTENGKPFQTTGATVFNPTLGTLEVFDGARWIPMCTDCSFGNDITGWWLNTIKGNSTNTSVLWHIRYVGDELRAKLYAGYQGRYREWTNEDFTPSTFRAGGIFVNVDSIPTNDFVLEPRAPGSWIMNPLSPDSPEYFSPVQNELWLNISQSDPNIIFTSLEYLRLVRLSVAPEIETFANPSFIDNTNPIKIFENAFQILLLNGSPQFSVDVQASDYPGFASFTAHKNLLLTSGVSYDSTVSDVWRTRTDFPVGIPFPFSTTFITAQPPNPRIGGKAIVSGFLAPYDILNNADGWEIGIADNDNGRNASEVLGPLYYDGANEKFMLTILDVDTSSLPSYDSNIHGVGQITVVVPPVTAASEYRELIAALHDLVSFADRATHTLIRPYFDISTFRLFPTFSDLQAGIEIGTASVFSLRSRGYNGTRSGALYVDIDVQNIITFPSIPTNDPTGISLYNDPSPTAFYSIDLFNYLDPSRTYNMYWALTGAPIPGSPVTTQKLVDFTQDFYGPGQPYYKTPGSKFIFQVDNYYNNYAFGNTPPDPAVWSIYSAGAYHDFNTLVFGIVDPLKTCGEVVAYISFLDCTGLDPIFRASLFPEFTSPNNGIGALSDCLALMMETLNQFNPTSYIINFRGNAGGLPLMTSNLASFFGNNRPGVDYSVSFADNGFRPGIPLQDIQNDGQLNIQGSIDTFKIIDTDLFSSMYPNSMVRTSGTKVFFLTDTNAASAADVMPHLFRNNDAGSPGDIGSGVTSYIVGDIDGRLFGNGSSNMYLFTNLSNNLIDANGGPVSTFRTQVDCRANLLRNGVNQYLLGNQNPVITPDTLVNMDIENTFWLDVGSKGIYPLNPIDGGTDPLVLPLSAGVTQPVYADQSTWRDRTLEACLTQAVPPGCFNFLAHAQNDTIKAHKTSLANHLANRSQTKRETERKELK